MNLRTLAQLALLATTTLAAIGCAAPATSDDSKDSESNLVGQPSSSGGVAPEEPVNPACVGNENKADINIFEDAEGKHRFRFVAGNGEILLSATKGFTTEHDATNLLFEIQKAGSDRSIYRIEDMSDGQFQLKVFLPGGGRGDDELVAISEGYASKSNAERAKERTAQIIDCMPKG